MTDPNAHFRSVLRGYDPAQVDQLVHELSQAAAAAQQEAGERTIQVSKLEAATGQLKSEIERHVEQFRALEEAQTKAAAPTYAGLGERIGSILALADKEAAEMRTQAQADAANHHALADESARATRQSADDYAAETRSAVDADVARILEDAKRHADSLLDDADREAMARREEAEAVYERARAKSAASAVDFETTLAARRDASALALVDEIAAAEQQLAEVRLRAERARSESEQAQHEAESRSGQQLEQATRHAQTLVAEAKIKAERIRADSERELAAATQRRDSINAQLTNVRQMLSTLGGVALIAPIEETEAVAEETEVVAEETEAVAEETEVVAEETEVVAEETEVVAGVEPQAVVTDAHDGAKTTDENTAGTDNDPAAAELTVEARADGESGEDTSDTADGESDVNGDGKKTSGSGRKVGSKR